MWCVVEGSRTRRAQKKIDPAGRSIRAGECLGSVASGCTSLDHRGDSPSWRPGWRYPASGTLQDAFNDARVLKNDRNRVGHLLGKGKPFLCHSRAYGGYR